MSQHVVIVGGGISGLATAWQLRRRLAAEQVRVTVLERDERPGGSAWTVNRDGYQIEIGPNGFLDNKPSTLELCRSVGLGDRLVRAEPASANRFVFLGDRLRKLPTSPGEFLRSDLLSWPGKLRVLAERMVPRRTASSDESIHDFGVRRIGQEATEKLLDAFVTGIMAGDPQQLSLPACFPRIAELERDFGSLIRAQGKLSKERRRKRELALQAGEKNESSTAAPAGGPGGALTAPIGGMGALIEVIAERLKESLRVGVEVESLATKPGGGWMIRSKANEQWEADAVVLASPAYRQAEILKPLDAKLADEVGAIPYTTAVVVAIGFRRDLLPDDLAGFGYLSPQRLGRPVLGMLWSSSIFPSQAPAGYFQFRAILGGWRRRDVLEWDDEEIIRAVRDDLRQTLGITALPAFTWVYRWERAIPQYHLGHLERLQRIEALLTSHRGLFLTGNSFRGVSLNDCTSEAERMAGLARSFLGSRESHRLANT